MNFKMSVLRLSASSPLWLFTPATMGAIWSTPKQTLPVHQIDLSSTDTVVLGAGVIGLATAYQLALAFEASGEAGSDISRPGIVVVESGASISPSASGQATGGLGDFGFGSDTAELGVLSYSLFQKVAFPNGPEKFGFSDSTVYRITPTNFTETPKPPNDWGPSPPVDRPLSALPNWIRPKSSWTVQLMSGPPHGAHLDPGQFCKFLYEECLRLGVKFIFDARATSVQPAEDTPQFSSIQVQKHDDSTLTISCRSVVIAAGPWSPRVFSTLFPHAAVKLPMNSTASAGNHFRVRTPRWKPSDDQKGSEQVFLQNDIPGGQGLDITSFLGGDLYVGGWGAIPEELPEFADAVKAQPTEIQRMVTLAKQYLNVPQENELEIFDAGRCYRPLATPNHPIIMKMNWNLLGLGTSQAPGLQIQSPDAQSKRPGRCHSSSVGGLFLNTAHFSDGVTLSLGSGKVMSELLLGVPPSIDISGLGLE